MCGINPYASGMLYILLIENTTFLLNRSKSKIYIYIYIYIYSTTAAANIQLYELVHNREIYNQDGH